MEEHGRLDIAVNNAGNAESVDRSATTSLDVSPSHFDATFRTLMTSAWSCMRHQIPAMLAGGSAAEGGAARTARRRHRQRLLDGCRPACCG